MKTIFYKRSDNEDGDYWLNNQPYNFWFELENTLYDPNGKVIKETKDEDGFIRQIVTLVVQDRFSDEGIIRRIGLHIIKD